MELTIDEQACDLNPEKCAAPGYDAARLASPDACREGRSMTLTLPKTPRNDRIVGHASDPHAGVRFNAELHRAELSASGAVLLAGTVRLLEASGDGYTLEIRDGGAGWASQAARKSFDEIGITYLSDLSPTTIFESWTDDKPVKFFPIFRDEYPQQNNPSDLLPAERMLSVDDYHPFLHIATLLRTIFSQAGYRIDSRFMESEYFQSLYMSGAYTSRDTTAAANRMGFFARRLAPVTATADYNGRIYADPSYTSNSVGNIVETATPLTTDVDGEPIPELMNNGGCFAKRNGRIVFTPPTEVSVGFEYYLRYTTDHRILSRTRLAGFDSFYLGAGNEMTFQLANRYEDNRSKLLAATTYRLIVFNHEPGATYELKYSLNGEPLTQWARVNSRTSLVSTPLTGTVSNPKLYILRGTTWLLYSGDWALYDGYINETGQTTVDVRLRTVAQIVSPTAPKQFDQTYFFGAESGMKLTLDKCCSLRPRFVSSPGFGSMLRFADVARHRIRQAALIEAVAHLFNLRFHTDNATRIVQIEPADDFFGAGSPVDWSTRTDFSQPVERTDRAIEVHERRTWHYLTGDGAVKRLDDAGGTPFGSWSFDVDSYAAKQGEQQLPSPLFRPTFNASGHYLNAPSALVMQVGDRDDAEEDGTNFTPRIVRFAGLHPLPDNERWGYPSHEGGYPLAAFHFAGDDSIAPFTLGFEDRDGLEGLHRFYDRQLAEDSLRERITLSLSIAPHEFEALLTPGTGAPDIRSTFRIDTGEGIVRATLHRIGEYDPEAASVRCTFTRLNED